MARFCPFLGFRLGVRLLGSGSFREIGYLKPDYNLRKPRLVSPRVASCESLMDGHRLIVICQQILFIPSFFIREEISKFLHALDL